MSLGLRLCDLHTAFLAALALALGAASGPAHAWDQVSDLPVEYVSAAPLAEYLTPSADGGHWAVARHRDNIISVDRYRADGSLAHRQFEAEISDQGGGAWATMRLQELADGSAVAYDAQCRLLRLDAGGGQQWLSAKDPAERPCVNLAASAGGAFWLAFDDASAKVGVRRRDSSGRDRGRRDTQVEGYVGRSNVLSIPDSESVYQGGERRVGVVTAAAVVRLAAAGNPEWVWRAADSEVDTRITRLVARPGGGVFALGADSRQALLIVALDADGRELQRSTLAAYSGTSLRAAQLHASGQLMLISQRKSDNATVIVLLDSNNQVRAVAELGSGEQCVSSVADCLLASQSDGSLAMLLQGASSLRLRRWSATGALLADSALSLPRADQEALAGTQGWWVREGGKLHRVELDGRVSERPLASRPGEVAPRLVGHFTYHTALADGGDLLLLGIRWQHRIPGGPVDPGGMLGANAFRRTFQYICLRDDRPSPAPHPLHCLEPQHGELLFATSGEPGLPLIWGTFNREMVAWLGRDSAGTLQLKRFDLVSRMPQSPLALPPLRIDGDRPPMILSDPDLGSYLTVIGVRADTGQTVAIRFSSQDWSSAEFPLDTWTERVVQLGSYLYQFRAVPSAGATAIDVDLMTLNDGRRLPSRRIADSVTPDWRTTVSYGFLGPVLTVTGVVPASGIGPDFTRVVQSNPDTGVVRWQRDLPISAKELRMVSGDGTAQDILLIAERAGALSLSKYQSHDGQTLLERALPCGGETCWPHAPGFNEHIQNLSLVANVYSPSSGRALKKLSVSVNALDLREVPLDQSGISGIWYHTATRGQGFVMSFDPPSRTLFAPWFTYAADADHEDQSAQRWYSLQGQVASQAMVANLQILRNRNGRFAQPPDTTAEVVGTAQLRFQNCDRATLSYRFNDDVQGGASGTMTWERLSPRLLGCRRFFNGGFDPPTLTLPDAGGFSRRQSGAWYDFANSGQGMMWEVQPASESTPGLLFGAWFTFDPQSPPNDPDAQDWVVLQGTLQGARDGRATLPILRVTGGALAKGATDNAQRIGEAQVHFTSCEQVQIEYRFDDSELAAEHAGRQGSLSLIRIGGCGPLG